MSPRTHNRCEVCVALRRMCTADRSEINRKIDRRTEYNAIDKTLLTRQNLTEKSFGTRVRIDRLCRTIFDATLRYGVPYRRAPPAR